MASAIYLPKIIREGAGASAQLPQVLAELGLSKPLIITDPFIQQCGYVDQIKAVLQQAGLSCSVFADCVADPTTDSLTVALAHWSNGQYDSVVAVGGGSSIDTAKAVAVLAVHGGEMRDYKAPSQVPVGVPIIAIPTTAGTGSEATRVAVVTDSASQEKMMCLGVGLMPSAALVDYELTLTMPYRLTADTGIDSLCHAMEAYVSRKSNAFTDGIALSALSAITANIRVACNEPDNLAARQGMMLAATQGGIAFSNASVTLIHGMSRPLGAFFHVPHGLSNAMLMPLVTAFSLSGALARYADCSRAMNFAAITDSDVIAGKKLLEGLYQLTDDLAVPTLQAFGVKAESYLAMVSSMSEQALSSGSPKNNPVVPSQQQIEQLYRDLW